MPPSMSRLLAPMLAVMLTAGPAEADLASDCTFNGIPLWGTVRIVDSHYADLEVRVVDNYPDLLVLRVDSYPDDCGEWEVVDSHYADFTIRFVDSHYADLDIQWVDSYPGLP